MSLRILLLVTLFITWLFPLSVRADIAPPDQPPGANPVPGEDFTQVRLLAESVLIDVQAKSPAGSLGQARVTADFTLRNLGSEAESMPVRFPLTFFNGYDNGFGKFPEIKDIGVKVNGVSTPTRRVNYGWSDFPNTPWVEFNTAFPPGEDIEIEVSYLQEGAGEYPFISFKYILETGAGWQGSIGTADLVVRLPYDANNQNVVFDEQIGWSQTTPGGVLSGREVRWHFEDFEPTWENNLEVSLVMPAAWRVALNEQANVTKNPADGEAWGRLGKIYKELSRLRRGNRTDAGGQELYRLSLEAYEKAVALRPEDAAWHAGFADLLWGHYYYDQYFMDQPDHLEMLRALEELRLSQGIDPENPKAIAILDDMRYAVPEAVAFLDDQYVLLWLTATPTPHPSSTAVHPTPTPEPFTATAPTATASTASAYTAKTLAADTEPNLPTPAAPFTTQPTQAPPTSPQLTRDQTAPLPQPRAGINCLGSAALLPLAAVLWMRKRRKAKPLGG